MGGIFSRRKRLFPKSKKVKNRRNNSKGDALQNFVRYDSDTVDCNNNNSNKNDIDIRNSDACNSQYQEENEPSRQPKLIYSPRTLLDTPNYDFRIEPLEQCGERVSDTHYFFFNERNINRLCHSTKERCNPAEMYANSSRLFNGYNEEPRLPYDVNQHYNFYCSMKQDQLPRGFLENKQHHNSLPIKRGRSDTTDYLYNTRRALIARMRLKIPQATDVESHGVLMGTNWNFDEAERRLKMELIHRANGANYKQCESLLTQNNWDLNATLKSIIPNPKQLPSYSLDTNNSNIHLRTLNINNTTQSFNDQDSSSPSSSVSPHSFSPNMTTSPLVVTPHLSPLPSSYLY